MIYMIRKLTINDQEQVLKYLYKEPSINIFIIGDIEQFGFDVDFQDVYAEYADNKILGVLLRYKENVIYYSQEQHFNTDFLEIINTFKYEFISAKGSIMELLKPHFKEMKEKPMYFCEANTFDPNLEVIEDDIIDVKTPDQARKLYYLLADIEEFESFKSEKVEKFITSKLQALKESVTYSIHQDDLCVCSVSTVADTTKAAMVVAVATHPAYRKRGYASKLMIKLLNEYINKRKKALCLFYDNPAAGKIYHRLGFKDIDKWVMLVRK